MIIQLEETHSKKKKSSFRNSSSSGVLLCQLLSPDVHDAILPRNLKSNFTRRRSGRWPIFPPLVEKGNRKGKNGRCVEGRRTFPIQLHSRQNGFCCVCVQDRIRVETWVGDG